MRWFILLFFAALGLCYIPIVEDGGLIPRQLLIAIGTLIGWFLLPTAARKEVRVTVPEGALLAWFSYMALSVLWALNPGEAWVWTGRWAALIGFYFWMKACWKSGQLTWYIVNQATIAFFLADAVWILLQALPLLASGQILEKAVRIVGSNGNKNLLATSLALLFPAALWALRTQPMPKWMYALLTTTGVGLLLFLQARATWVGTAAAGFVLLFLFAASSMKTRWLFALIVSGFSAGLWGLFTLANSWTYGKRFQGQDSIIERLDLWRISTRMVYEHPWLGVGAGQWQIWMAKYGLHQFDNWKVSTALVTFQRPHNDYFWLLTEGGLVGFGLYLLFFWGGVWLLLARFHKSESLPSKLDAATLVALMVGYATISQFDFPLERPEIQALLFVWIANAFASAEAPTRKIPNWLPVAFAASGLVLGFLRFGSEVQIPALKNAVKTENYAKAMKLYPKANTYWCRQDATSVPLAWYAGIVAEHAGSWQQALSLYKEGLSTSRYNVRNINSAGIAFYRLGQQDSAIAYFRRSIEKAKGWDEPYLNWMAALFAQPATQMQAFQLMASLPDYKPDQRWPLFKRVLLEYRLKSARPSETPENQVRIDSLLADKALPGRAYNLYLSSNKSDTFWR